MTVKTMKTSVIKGSFLNFTIMNLPQHSDNCEHFVDGVYQIVLNADDMPLKTLAVSRSFRKGT
jgi:hypothetical protein